MEKLKYKLYKQYNNVPLIKSGFNTYNTKGNTKLGKLIRQAQKELKNCIIWYEVVNIQAGTVNIIYAEVNKKSLCQK